MVAFATVAPDIVVCHVARGVGTLGTLVVVPRVVLLVLLSRTLGLPVATVTRVVAPRVGDRGPKGRHLIRGEECWDIVPELAPEARETVIDKTGYGAFFRTNLEAVLRAHGVRDLIITGVTTDCCVNSTLRQCEDRGFDCLVLEDCCASPSADAHAVTIQQLRTRGIFGTVATSDELLAVLVCCPIDT